MKQDRVAASLRAPSSRYALAGIIILLVATTTLHYLPNLRTARPALAAFLNRHAVVRILYLFPVAIAALHFRKTGGVLVLFSAIVAMLPRVIWISALPADALLETIVTAGVGSAVIWAIETQAREKELRQQIAAENHALYERTRYYAQRVIQAQEIERQRIARDLHDETIQMLIVLSRQIERLIVTPEFSRGPARERLEGLHDLLKITQQTLRGLIYDLRPPTLDHLGLAPAIQGMIDRLSDDSTCAVDLQVTGHPRRLEPNVELALFRIAQEAIHNVQQHAHAKHATVRLDLGTSRVRLEIEDDGQGFEAGGKEHPPVVNGRLGLLGMTERAQTLGGTFAVDSNPGQGCRVVAEIPLRSEAILAT